MATDYKTEDLYPEKCDNCGSKKFFPIPGHIKCQTCAKTWTLSELEFKYQLRHLKFDNDSPKTATEVVPVWYDQNAISWLYDTEAEDRRLREAFKPKVDFFAHPWKNSSWYRKRKEAMPAHLIAQELDIDHTYDGPIDDLERIHPSRLKFVSTPATPWHFDIIAAERLMLEIVDQRIAEPFYVPPSYIALLKRLDPTRCPECVSITQKQGNPLSYGNPDTPTGLPTLTDQRRYCHRCKITFYEAHPHIRGISCCDRNFFSSVICERHRIIGQTRFYEREKVAPIWYDQNQELPPPVPKSIEHHTEDVLEITCKMPPESYFGKIVKWYQFPRSLYFDRCSDITICPPLFAKLDSRWRTNESKNRE